MEERIFIPGSQWLYFKIYTGQKSADHILMQLVYPYLRTLSDQKVIRSYFFIRYSDPEFHIRLRVYVNDRSNYGEVFQIFYEAFQPAVSNGQITRIMCDTYNREIERYGQYTIELLENIFHVDTLATLELLIKLSDQPTESRDTIRWKLSLRLLDDILTAFGYDLAGKNQIMARIAENFRKEFGFITHDYTKQLNDKYRASKQDIDRVLSLDAEINEYIPILTSRMERLTQIADEIKEIEASGISNMTTNDLIGSILHMTMNRWFRSKNRLHELVIYNFMNKYYDSALIRERHGI